MFGYQERKWKNERELVRREKKINKKYDKKK